MSTITAITPTKRDPDRATVRVEGRVVATVSVRSIADLRLAVGQPCDEALLKQLERAASTDKAMKQAMNRLGRRAMSRGQLARKLSDLGYEPATCDAVLDRLTNVGLLDDRAFAEALIRETKRQKPAGPQLLRQKLRQKYLPPELIEQVLAETADTESDAAGAIQLAQKRASQLQNVDAMTRRRRIYGLLARRGFTPDIIETAMRSVDEK